MLYEHFNKLDVLCPEDVEELTGDDGIFGCSNMDTGAIDLNGCKDEKQMRRLLVETAKEHGLHIVYFTQTQDKDKIVSKLSSNNSPGSLILVCRNALKQEVEEVTPYNKDDTFSKRVETLGLLNKKEILFALKKANANKELVAEADRYLEEEESGYAFLDSNSITRRIAHEISELLKVFVVTETIEESVELMTESFCYSDGVHYVNANRHYFTREKLSEDFCEYPRI